MKSKLTNNNTVYIQNSLNDKHSMISTAITVQQHYIILYMNTEESVGKQLKQYNSVTNYQSGIFRRHL